MSSRSPDDVIQLQKGSVTVRELRERVKLLEPGVVYFREVPDGTVPAFEILMERVRELGEAAGNYVVLIDLVEATRPRPDLVEHIFKSVRAIGLRWCVVQPGSGFMRAVVRFVIAHLVGLPKVSVHETVDEALVTARTALRQAASG